MILQIQFGRKAFRYSRKIQASPGLFIHIAEVFDKAFPVAPVLLDLDPALEVDLGAQEPFGIFPGLGADALEHLTLLADEPALVSLPLTVDHRVNIDDLL